MFLGSLCFFLYLIIYVKEFFLSCVCRSSCHHSKEKEQFRKWTGKSINVSHFLCCCCKIFKVRLTILGYYALGLSLCWVTRVSLAVDEQNGGLKKLNIPFILVSIFIAFFTFEKVWNQVDIILRANVLYILRKENPPPFGNSFRHYFLYNKWNHFKCHMLWEKFSWTVRKAIPVLIKIKPLKMFILSSLVNFY